MKGPAKKSLLKLASPAMALLKVSASFMSSLGLKPARTFVQSGNAALKVTLAVRLSTISTLSTWSSPSVEAHL